MPGLPADVSFDVPQLLSNNTRRTKVVELSSGTHRLVLTRSYIGFFF